MENSFFIRVIHLIRDIYGTKTSQKPFSISQTPISSPSQSTWNWVLPSARVQQMVSLSA